MVKTSQNISFNFGFITIFTFLILFLAQNQAKSQESHSYNACKRVNGNYRAFGNTCLDNCLPQFSEYRPCFNIVKYGCDCGVDSCFFKNKCITKVEFKKTFKEISRSAEEKNIKRMNKMVKLMKESPAYSKFVHNLFEGYTDSKTQEIKSKAQLMSERFRNEAAQQVQAQNQQKQGQPQPAAARPAPAPIAPTTPVQPKVPQFFIDKQEAGKPSGTATIPTEELDLIFPVVPLPGARKP